MVDKTATKETRLATITLVEPGFVMQHFKAGERIDSAGLAENRSARERLVEDGECVILSVFPDNIDFDAHIAQDALSKKNKTPESVTALAVVTQNQVLGMMSKLYFTCFPKALSTQVFKMEIDARNWLREQRRNASGDRG